MPSTVSAVHAEAPGGYLPTLPDIGDGQLVEEVFEGAPPAVQEHMLTQLVGRVYEAAPPALRRSLLEHLMRPLGVLSLVAVGGGVFAKLRFRGGWPELSIRMEDLQEVRPGDVLALVNHVQQMGTGFLTGLAQLLAHAPPGMAQSGAAVVLVALLLKKAQHRRSDDLLLP
jgi:hypothetical protein